MKMGENINKRTFIDIVEKKLKNIGYIINGSHIKAIVNIMFEEVLKEIVKNKIFNIGGFGTFIFRKLAPRTYHNVITRKMETAEGNNILEFKLDKNLQKTLLNNLDINKTFGDQK